MVSLFGLSKYFFGDRVNIFPIKTGKRQFIFDVRQKNSEQFYLKVIHIFCQLLREKKIHIESELRIQIKTQNYFFYASFFDSDYITSVKLFLFALKLFEFELHLRREYLSQELYCSILNSYQQSPYQIDSIINKTQTLADLYWCLALQRLLLHRP